MTDDSSKVTDSVGFVSWVDRRTVKVSLPKDAVPSEADPVLVQVKLIVASGPWGGDGGSAPHNLVKKYEDNDVYTCVVLHELAHLLKMVPVEKHDSCPPGLTYKDHGTAYFRNGGHCSEGATGDSPDSYEDGACVMFHRADSHIEYCETCSRFIKAQDAIQLI